MSLNLEILICTINGGIRNVQNILLPQQKGIAYLVSWQQTAEFSERNIPEELLREDVRVFPVEGQGLSANRNNAIEHATGDICLIADDDVHYEFAGLERLVSTFVENPSLDLGTFKYESGSYQKDYPAESFDLRYRPRFYHCSSIEIAFRRTSVQGKIRFNELFGIGAPVLGAGEEFIFLRDALKQNLTCRFYPITVVSHEGPSTAQANGGKPSVIMARGVAIRIRNPYTWRLRCIVNARRISRTTDAGFLTALRYLIKGSEYAGNKKLL